MTVILSLHYPEHVKGSKDDLLCNVIPSSYLEPHRRMSKDVGCFIVIPSEARNPYD